MKPSGKRISMQEWATGKPAPKRKTRVSMDRKLWDALRAAGVSAARLIAVAPHIEAYAAEAVARERAEWLAAWDEAKDCETHSEGCACAPLRAKLAQARGAVKRGGTK